MKDFNVVMFFKVFIFLLKYNVSSIQQSESVTYIYLHICTLFHTLFHCRLLQDTEYGSVYYRVNTCLFYI